MNKDKDVRLELDPHDETPALRSLFTSGIPTGERKTLEPIQLVVTIYKPELEHIDRLRNQLKRRGVGDLSRDELVRYSINLLSEKDFLKG